MIFDEVDQMICKAKSAPKVVIVGAGRTYINLYGLLSSYGIHVSKIFDNNDELLGRYFYGVEVTKPYKEEEGTLYIIDAKSESAILQFEKQLIEIGINQCCIIRQPHAKSNCIDIADVYELKKSLDELYYERFGRTINWENPRTYNEIINYEKVYDHDPRKTRLADKFLVREYVSELIGDEYLTKLLGHWKNADSIDFNALPNKFVLKTNNGSGRNIIVNGKENIEEKEIKEKLDIWMKPDYWEGLYEFQYKDISPVIICEEYLDDISDEANEFKFYCFNGTVKYIGCERNSHKPGWVAAIYDKEWNKQSFGYALPIDEEVRKKPEQLEKMIKVSEKLGKDFRHVRVDLYGLPDGRILFGELTFSSWGGMKHFFPDRYDNVFGEFINC